MTGCKNTSKSIACQLVTVAKSVNNLQYLSRLLLFRVKLIDVKSLSVSDFQSINGRLKNFVKRDI